MDMYNTVRQRLEDRLEQQGFSVFPFLVGWYNDCVEEVFNLAYTPETLAFVVISNPDMFELTFKPYMLQGGYDEKADPIDSCMVNLFHEVTQSLDHKTDVMHDFQLVPGTRRPRVLVQTAGHVAGAARLYRRSDVTPDPWPTDKRLYPVSMHARFGGWFGLRAVLVMPTLRCPDLPRQEPPDVLPSREARIQVLERFNDNWRDWSYRDVMEPEARYSEEQKQYFACPPAERRKLFNL